MKLFIPVSLACAASSQSASSQPASSQPASTGKTLLQEIEDVFKDDEDKDISYSNSKLANTRLVRIFPSKLQYILFD